MGRNRASSPYAFAKWLDMTMENRGLSNRELAAIIGVHDSVVGRWRAGKTTPSIESCQDLAAALGVDWIRLAATAGRVAAGPGAEPLPMPEPTAVRARIRQQLEGIKGIAEEDIQAALDSWDKREIGTES